MVLDRKRLRAHPNERIDLDDFDRSSFEYTDQKTAFDKKRNMIGKNGHILDGFAIKLSDQTASPGQITVFNGNALDSDGRHLNNQEEANQRTVLLSGAGLTFHIAIKFTSVDTDVDSRAFWDPTFPNASNIPGKETELNVTTRTQPDWDVVVATAGSFPPAPAVPLAILITDGGNVIDVAINPDMALAQRASVVEFDAATTDTALKLIDTRIFPSTGEVNVEGFIYTFTANDRDKGILTIPAPGLNEAHPTGDLVFFLENAAIVNNTAAEVQVPQSLRDPAAPLQGDKYWQGDEVRGSALADAGADLGTFDKEQTDKHIQTEKDIIDWSAGQMRQMKWGSIRTDGAGGAAPPVDFKANPRYFDNAGGIAGARTNSVSVGDGVNSFGDFNALDFSGIQAALTYLQGTGGGTLYIKRGTYTDDAEVNGMVYTGVGNTVPLTIIGDGTGVDGGTIVTNTAVASAIPMFLINSSPANFINITLTTLNDEPAPIGQPPVIGHFASTGVDKLFMENVAILGGRIQLDSATNGGDIAAHINNCNFFGATMPDGSGVVDCLTGQVQSLTINDCILSVSEGNILSLGSLFLGAPATVFHEHVVISNCSISGDAATTVVVEQNANIRFFMMENCEITNAQRGWNSLLTDGTVINDLFCIRNTNFLLNTTASADDLCIPVPDVFSGILNFPPTVQGRMESVRIDGLANIQDTLPTKSQPIITVGAGVSRDDLTETGDNSLVAFCSFVFDNVVVTDARLTQAPYTTGIWLRGSGTTVGVNEIKNCRFDKHTFGVILEADCFVTNCVFDGIGVSTVAPLALADSPATNGVFIDAVNFGSYHISNNKFFAISRAGDVVSGIEVVTTGNTATPDTALGISLFVSDNIITAIGSVGSEFSAGIRLTDAGVFLSKFSIKNNVISFVSGEEGAVGIDLAVINSTGSSGEISGNSITDIISGIDAYGVLARGSSIGSYVIRNNLFENIVNGPSAGNIHGCITVASAVILGLIIDGNKFQRMGFVNASSTTKTLAQHIIGIFPTSFCNNVTITNNLIDGSGVRALPAVNTDARGIVFDPSGAAGGISGVSITNNTIISTTQTNPLTLPHSAIVPGIVVTDTGISGSKDFITGLRITDNTILKNSFNCALLATEFRFGIALYDCLFQGAMVNGNIVERRYEFDLAPSDSSIAYKFGGIFVLQDPVNHTGNFAVIANNSVYSSRASDGFAHLGQAGPSIQVLNLRDAVIAGNVAAMAGPVDSILSQSRNQDTGAGSIKADDSTQRTAISSNYVFPTRDDGGGPASQDMIIVDAAATDIFVTANRTGLSTNTGTVGLAGASPTQIDHASHDGTGIVNP